MSNNWNTPVDAESYFRLQEKRLQRAERRHVVSIADQLGPGMAAQAVQIIDWNSLDATLNGFYYTQPGAQNSPDPALSWTGHVIAKDDGTGMQQVWNTDGPETLYWIRTYSPVGDGTVTFTEWKKFASASGYVDDTVLHPQVVQDIQTALNNAADAMNYAEVANTTFRQDAAPVSTADYTLRTGDTWFDTNDSNHIYIWDAATSEWVDAADLRVAQALQDAADAQAQAQQAADDAAASLDFAQTKNTTYRQDTKPTGGTYITGDTWFDTAHENHIYVYDGIDFVDAQDQNIVAAQAAADNAATAAANAQTTANSANSAASSASTLAGQKNSIFVQSPTPSALKVGDVWIDTGNGNIIKTASSTGTGGWVAKQDTAIQTAINSANGKNKITYSTSAASGTNTAGDTWFQYNAQNNVIGQWQGAGGTTWNPRSLDNAVIATLDAAKITSGFISAARIQTGSLSIGQVSALQTTLDAKETPSGAQSKATAAQNAAETYADTAASNAQAAAISDAAQKYDAAKALVEDWTYPSSTEINGAYLRTGTVAANQIIVGGGDNTALLTYTSNDAQSKASTAQTTAISTAASDASTKASNAQSAAIAAAATDATNKASNAQSAAQTYADTAATNAQSAAILAASITGTGTNRVFHNVLSWQNKSANLAGSIVIHTPITPTAKMTRIEIQGYNYLTGQSSIDVTASGYMYNSTSILNHGQINRGTMQVSVKFAITAGGTIDVILTPVSSTTWQYPEILVREVGISYTAAPDSWLNGWSAEVLTTLPTYPYTLIPTTLDVVDSAMLAQDWRYTGTTTIDGGNLQTDTVKAGQIAADAITSKHTITGATIQTLATANRGVKITSAGLLAYNTSGTQTFFADANTGAVTITGTLNTGSAVNGATITGGTIQTETTANRGAKINSAGMTFYTTSGSAALSFVSSTGALTITGPVVSGGSVTGSTLQTTATANAGVKINSTGLYVYNGSIATFTADAATGNVTFTGTMSSGSFINSSTVTGGTLQTETTLNRGIKINSSGFTAYDGSGNAVVTITTAGVANFKGAINTGSTVTGATILGGSVQTQGTGASYMKMYDDGSGGVIVGYDETGSQVGRINPSAGGLFLRGTGSGFLKITSTQVVIGGTTTLDMTNNSIFNVYSVTANNKIITDLITPNTSGVVQFDVANGSMKLAGGSNIGGRVGMNPLTAGNGTAIVFTSGWAAITTDDMNGATANSVNTRPFYAKTVNGFGAYVNASDEREKNTIKDVDPEFAVDTIKRTRVRSYYMNEVDPDRQQYGVISQEMQDVLPSAVTDMTDPDDDDHRYGMSYQDLWSLHLATTQALIARVEELEKRPN